MTSDESAVREAARWRRLDAELGEVFGSATPHSRSLRQRAGAGRWWVAAMVLLGIGATVAIARLQAELRLAQEPATDPICIPGAIPFGSVTDLAAWPVDLSSCGLFLKAGDPADGLAGLRRLPGLRSLTLLGEIGTQLDLEPLAALAHVQVLALPVAVDASARQLAPIASMPQLQDLTLHLRRAWRGEDVAVLRGAKALRRLTLSGGSLEAAVLRQVGTLPRLEALRLEGVGGCSEATLLALRTCHSLQRLELSGMGPSWSRGGAEVTSVGLTPGLAAALRELPLLRAVVIEDSDVSVDAIARLPRTLTHLGLLQLPQGDADLLRAVGELTSLRRLDLDPGTQDTVAPGHAADPELERRIVAALATAPPRPAVWQAQAELLRRLPITELQYQGGMPEAVRDALAGSAIERLRLRSPVEADVTAAARLPKLRCLCLEECSVRPQLLAPLANVPALEQLQLRFVRGATVAQVQQQLPRVEILAHGF